MIDINLGSSRIPCARHENHVSRSETSEQPIPHHPLPIPRISPVEQRNRVTELFSVPVEEIHHENRNLKSTSWPSTPYLRRENLSLDSLDPFSRSNWDNRRWSIVMVNMSNTHIAIIITELFLNSTMNILSLWDARSSECLWISPELILRLREQLLVSFSPDGRYIGFYDHYKTYVRCLDITSKNVVELKHLRCHVHDVDHYESKSKTGSVVAIALHPTGNAVVAKCHKSRNVTLRRNKRSKPFINSSLHVIQVPLEEDALEPIMYYTTDGNFLIVHTRHYMEEDSSLNIFNVRTREKTRRIVLNRPNIYYPIYGVFQHQNKDYFLGMMVEMRRKYKIFQKETGRVDVIAFSYDGRDDRRLCNLPKRGDFDLFVSNGKVYRCEWLEQCLMMFDGECFIVVATFGDDWKGQLDLDSPEGRYLAYSGGSTLTVIKPPRTFVFIRLTTFI